MDLIEKLFSALYTPYVNIDLNFKDKTYQEFSKENWLL